MRRICCLNDLQMYGVVLLTGESDALSYRVLCDLTTKAHELFCEAFGQLGGTKLAEPWNSGHGMDMHVSSVLLASDAWRQLGPIALLNDGCHTVVQTTNALFGFSLHEQFKPAEVHWDEATDQCVVDRPPHYTADDQDAEWLPWPYDPPQRIFRSPQTGPGRQPVRGFRNVHAWTGRAT